MIFERTPLYNLNAVLMETGLKADVLRAWERRYELPLPQRSTGGHRLYSAYDIETIKWLKARQAEGLSISRAVDLWREIQQSGLDPLSGHEHRAIPAPQELAEIDTRLDNLREHWVEACLKYDDQQAEAALNQAFALYPVEMVCTNILQQGLNRIGEEWYRGKVSAQQEHFASALATRRLETLISGTPAPTRQHCILVGCPPGEWHALPALMLSLFLRRKGLKVIYLGANIPSLQIEETAAAIRPDLTVLAAQQLTSAASLQALAVSLQRLQLPLAYGGLIFHRIPALRQRIPAHFLGESLEEGLLTIEKLLASPQETPAPSQPDAPIRETARLWQEYRPLIERELTNVIQRAGMDYRYIQEASLHFTNGLGAALELGDLAYLETDLQWVGQLLSDQQIPGERLDTFLVMARQAILNQMGEKSTAITGWLDAYLERRKA